MRLPRNKHRVRWSGSPVGSPSNRDRCWEVNVLGTRRALDAAVAGGARRFVRFSSVRAFSDLDFPDGVDELHPARPDGHRYVDTKVASEQVVLQAHAAGEIGCTIVRPGDGYGPGSPPWTLWPVLGVPFEMFFVPDDDRGCSARCTSTTWSTVWSWRARPTPPPARCSPSPTGVGMTNDEFFGHYARMLGVALSHLPADEMRDRFEASARADVAEGREPAINAETVDYLLRRGTCSIAKARRVLGYEPKVDLAEGMRRTEAWLRENALLP